MPSTYDKRGDDNGYYSDTVTVTQFSTSSTVILALPANPNRKGFSIYNPNASNSLYVRFGSDTNQDTRRIAADSSYDMFFPFVYRGPVYVRRNGAATGTIFVTEHT